MQFAAGMLTGNWQMLQCHMMKLHMPGCYLRAVQTNARLLVSDRRLDLPRCPLHPKVTPSLQDRCERWCVLSQDHWQALMHAGSNSVGRGT